MPVILVNWPHIRPSAVQFPGLQRPRAQHCPFPSKSGPHMNFKGTKSQNPGGIWGLGPTTTALSPWERSKHLEHVYSFHSFSLAPNDLLGWAPGELDFYSNVSSTTCKSRPACEPVILVPTSQHSQTWGPTVLDAVVAFPGVPC